MRKHILLFCLLLPVLLIAQPKIQLVTYATGFTRPLDIENCGDSRLFVVEQAGKIWMLDSLGNRLPQPFLDISARVNSSGNEQGLLGLAFHPDYLHNGYFFVNYISKTGTNGPTRIVRFSRDSTNANLADPNSEYLILEQQQPYNNHNGGCLRFSPLDGYLYIGLGDGGSGGDPTGNGQNKATFLGKILRIDVNSTATPYAIPPGNPFADSLAYFPEIWDLGMRNPWRFSFDRLTGDLWIGDVGQSAREELDFEPAGQGGHNYGWRCYEGNQPYNTSGCLPMSHFTFPVFDYVNPTIGCSVVGGFVYRGAQYPEIYGSYLFTDYCSGRWWVTRHTQGNNFTTTQIADLTNNEYTSLGQDRNGELYLTGLVSGKIYRINELCSSYHVTGQAGGAVCDSSFSGTIFLQVTGGAAPVIYKWSNGSTDQNIVYLNPGTYTVSATDGNGCLRTDTFTIASASPPIPVVSLLSGTTTLCPGDTARLQASDVPSGNGYQWYIGPNVIPNAMSQQLTVSTAGVYSVVSTGVPCNSLHSAGFTIKKADEQPISILGPQVLCPGDSVALNTYNIPQGALVTWYKDGQLIPGAGSPQLIATQPGTYQVRFAGVCGPVVSNDFSLPLEVILLPEIFKVQDSLFIAQGWQAYQWYLNGIPIQGATSGRYVPTESGTYICICTSLHNCMYKTAGVDVVIAGAAVPESVLHFSLAPNPATETIILDMELKQTEHFQLSLTDLNDRVMFLQTHDARLFKKSIDLHGLPSGTYILRVQMESGSFVRKIIKL